MSAIREIMKDSPVIPVVTLEDARHAAPIAAALVESGLRVVEITLRTSAALEAIAAAARIEGAIVGAGTVLNPHDLVAATDAGAKFIVSPGLTEPLARAAAATGAPFLPGVATASDIMRGLDLALGAFKFFPAEATGGRAALRSFAAPFHQVRFCPTGGVTAENAADWLAMPEVICVGGSWIVPPGAPDIAAIRARAKAAAALRRAN